MNTLFKELSENHENASQDLTAKSLQDYIDYHRSHCGGIKTISGKLTMSNMAMAAILSSSTLHQGILLSGGEASQFNAILTSAANKLALLTTRPPIENKLYQALRESREGLDDPDLTAAIDAEPDVIF